MLDRGQGVGDGPDPHALDIGRVVPGASVMIVLALGDTVINQEGEKRSRKIVSIDPLDDVVPSDLDIDEMVHLSAEGLDEILKRRKGPRISRFDTDPLADPRVETVIEGDFQDFRKVEVSGQVVVLLSENSRFHTPAGASRPCVLQRFPLPDHLLDDSVCVKDGGLAETCPDNLQSPFQETFGRLLADLDHRTRLEKAHLLDDIKKNIGQLIDPV